MTNFESSKIVVQKPAHELFIKFSDMRNFAHLAPPELNFSADENKCSFNVPQAGVIDLVITEKAPFTKIVVAQGTQSQLKFNLQLNMNDNYNETTTAQIILLADLPIFIKPMVSKPLQNFVDLLAEGLKRM